MEIKARDGTDDFQFLAQVEGDEKKKFAQWASKFGKHYKGKKEWFKRLKNWIKNNKTIIKNNWKAWKSGLEDPVILDHNENSDKSHEEMTHHMGLKPAPIEPTE